MSIEQQCPEWVIRVAAVAGQNQDLSVVGPIATKLLQRSECSDVPIAANAPQQTAASFDHLVGAGKERFGHGEAEHLGGLEVDD